MIIAFKYVTLEYNPWLHFVLPPLINFLISSQDDRNALLSIPLVFVTSIESFFIRIHSPVMRTYLQSQELYQNPLTGLRDYLFTHPLRDKVLILKHNHSIQWGSYDSLLSSYTHIFRLHIDCNNPILNFNCSHQEEFTLHPFSGLRILKHILTFHSTFQFI